MPNVIKYSTSTVSNTLKKGNMVIGINNVGFGPTSSTDFWNGNTPPSSGYSIFVNNGTSGAASLYPPLTIPAGLTSLGAHGADWAYQEYLKRRGQPQQGYEEQPAQYAIGGLVFKGY